MSEKKSILGALKALRKEFKPRSGISAGVVGIEAVPVAVGFCRHCLEPTGAVLWQEPSSATWHKCSCGHMGSWISQRDLSDDEIGSTEFHIGLELEFEAMEASVTHC